MKADNTPLPDDYPVYWDYMYMADDTPVRSDMQGTVLDLKRDLRGRGIKAENIYSFKFTFERD